MEWRDVPGYVGYYQASDDGHVARVTKKGTRKLVPGSVQRDHDTSRIVVALTRGGMSHRFQRGRLIWETFNGEIPEGKTIRHLNFNSLDDRLENLALMSSSVWPPQSNADCLMKSCDLPKKDCLTCGFNKNVHEKRIENGKLKKGKDGLWRLFWK